MIYLLDTNVISGLMKSRPSIVARFRYIPARECAISSITAHELYYGALRHPSANEYLRRLDILTFEILDFNRRDARRAGEIRTRLASVGTPIGPLDVLIAAQAMERDLTVVTHNVKEFGRVPDLRCEDWEI